MTAKLRPRISYVTTYDPANMQNGGAAWVDQKIIQELSTVGDVACLSVCEPAGVPLEIRSDLLAKGATLLRMFTTNEPLQTAKFKSSRAWNRRSRNLAHQLINSDIVISSQWPALVMLSELGMPPAVHVAHNADYVLAATHDSFLMRGLGNARRTAKHEARYLQLPGRVLTLSATDARRLQAMGVATARPLDLRIERSRGAQSPVNQQRTLSIGFIGKASWPPNKAALRVLADQVLPALRASHSDGDFRLIVAGRGTESLSLPGATVLGPIEDVSDFYSAVDVVVVPRLGVSTGVSIKLLEAVEHGVPAIAPAALTEDAGLRHGYVNAEHPAEIVHALATAYKGGLSTAPVRESAEMGPRMRLADALKEAAL